MKKKLRTIPCLLLCVMLMFQSVHAASFLVPVGQVIGLELEDNSVTVAAFDEALGQNAEDSGLQIGDKILTINNKPIRSIADVRSALIASKGTAELSVLRNGNLKNIRITPNITDKGPKLGIYLKDSITGVGTVTWYDPDSHTFGALGHGVSSRSGELIHMEQGQAYEAGIISVQKGKAGQPGQLLGTMDSQQPLGTLTKNTSRGIFGTCPSGWAGEKLPIASQNEIQKGPAVIRSTIHGNIPGEYSVEILKIYPSTGSGGRNMLLKITDPELLDCTGGIVQGMSGSPIIQNGKLIGAVTHVLVNDPTKGYGIFIDNMLDAAA